MRIMTVKKLHFAASVEELQKKADINKHTLGSKDTSKLCKSADKICKEAQKYYHLQDEEMAYIFYSKFIELMLILKERKDFDDDFLWKALKRSIKDAMVRATELKLSLSKRYAAQQEAQQVFENCQNYVECQNKIREAALPEKSNESISVTDNLSFEHASDSCITASELLTLMQEKKHSYVIMDSRSSNDFQESHIKISNCINVPSEILKPGVTAKKLEELLPSSSIAKWRERCKVDYVIMVDWDTKDSSLEANSSIFNLREAMCRWDLEVCLRRQPYVLIGGYKDWVLKYPMYCTKALDILSLEFSPKQLPHIADVSDIQFPDFDENESLVMDKNKKNAILRENAKSHNSNQNKPREQMNNVFSKITERGTPFKVADNPNVNVDISSAKLFHPALEEQKSEPVKVIPKIDRSLKPSNTLNCDNNADVQTAELTSKSHQADFKSNEPHLLAEHEAGENIKLSREKSDKEKKHFETDKQYEQENIDEKEHHYSEDTENNIKKKPCLKKQSEEENKRKQKEEAKKLELNFRNLNMEKENNRSFVTSASAKDQAKGGDASSITKDDGTRPLTRSYSSPNIAQLVQHTTVVDNNRSLPSFDRSLKPKVDRMLSIPQDNPAIMRNLNPTYGYYPERPVTGLRNLGNTCFMNAIIQCLSNTEQFSNYFLEEHYKKHLRRNKHGDVTEEFAAVIRGLWTGFKCIAPKDFKNCLAKYIPMYSGNEQQDGHEFLMLLLDKLHNELNQGHNLEPLANLDSLPVNKATEKFWQDHQVRNKSLVSETFEGLLKSTLSCCSCNKTSTSYEVFSCLSLPISNKKTVKDCLEGFLKSEKISGEGAWHCPACKQKKDAEKILTICKYPKVLIIQLKRFSYTGMWKQKLQSTIEYQPTLDVQGKLYELYGIVNHLGYLEGGHYTACCKNPNSKKWYKYDDHDTSEITFSELPTAAAYLLFYTEVDNKCR